MPIHPCRRIASSSSPTLDQRPLHPRHPNTVPLYLWESGRVLVNMDEGRKRLQFMRRDPRVSLTVLGKDSWYHQVSLRGKVVSIEEDAGLSDIDRISRHYTAEAYSDRDRRRYSARIEVAAWWGWAVSRPWEPDE